MYVPQQQAFALGQGDAMMLQLVRAQALRALGRRAEAAAALESVVAQGSELPLYSLRACVVRRTFCVARRSPRGEDKT